MDNLPNNSSDSAAEKWLKQALDDVIEDNDNFNTQLMAKLAQQQRRRRNILFATYSLAAAILVIALLGSPITGAVFVVDIDYLLAIFAVLILSGLVWLNVELKLD